jgi:V/A-type H+-transporting ATPase subunit A
MSTKGKVAGIVSNLVTIEVDGPVGQNEICYIDLHGVKLMAEVIKVTGNQAFVQVFESTRGLYVGCEAEFTGHMLEVTMGPGMLSRNYDGLQNDLDQLSGMFLKRGEYSPALDEEKTWRFKPLAKEGDTVRAGDWIGEVQEGWIAHKIMVPFNYQGTGTLKSVVSEGDCGGGYRSGRQRSRPDHDHALAGQGRNQGLQAQAPAVPDHGNRCAQYRHAQPHDGGRNRLYPRPVRLR